MYKYLLAPLVVALALLFAAPYAMARDAYLIKAGDTLQLEVLEDSTLNRNLLVLPDGSISVPSLGTVVAAGRSVDELRASITKGLTPSFNTKPTVYLSVGQVAASSSRESSRISVFAMGEVAKPGRIETKPGTTILQFLAESGGLTNFAATKRIQLRRRDRASGEDKVYFYDYKAVMNGIAIPSITLQDGDVIVVPQRRLFE